MVNAPGDSILAELSSVVDAVAAAVEIQWEPAERNASLSDDRRMLFRIGINLGDVVVEDDSICGDDVAVATRLETLAEPGCRRLLLQELDENLPWLRTQVHIV